MPNRKNAPTKPELARFKAMNDLGLSPHAIAKRVGRDPKTVRKYLQSDVYQDPAIQDMVDKIKEKEIADLYLLGAKARQRLHDLLDDGDTKTIETVAVMDRSFQQRRLLEGQSTVNMATFHADIQAAKELLKNKDFCMAESDREGF
ncbi:MAG: hypothetical protein JEZ11_17605 [Desulfobacterales bacterium]|nr:hypothetical protein [Desulfobacterales bacterium]